LNGVPHRLPPNDGMEAYDEVDSNEEVQQTQKGRSDLVVDE